MPLAPQDRPGRPAPARRVVLPLRVVQGAAALLLVVPVLIGTAACGGGERSGGPSTTTTSAPSWSSRLDDECAALDEQFDHLAAADPGTADEAVTYAEDVDAFAESLVAVLDGVGAEGQRSVEPLQDAAIELEAATSRLLDGAIARDRVTVDAATAEVASVTPRLNELAAELGLASCGGF